MAYLENPDWKEYYESISPSDRKNMFEEISAKGDDGGNALRKKLYEMRHTDPKHPGKAVDKGVWQMVVLPSHNRSIFSPKAYTSGMIRESMEALGLKEIKDDLSRSVVYWEIRNVARRYFSTCVGPNYARKAFGILASSDSEKLSKTAKDIWVMAESVPSKFGMTEEMKVFSDALIDELYSYYPDGKKVYEEFKAKKNK